MSLDMIVSFFSFWEAIAGPGQSIGSKKVYEEQSGGFEIVSTGRG